MSAWCKKEQQIFVWMRRVHDPIIVSIQLNTFLSGECTQSHTKYIERILILNFFIAVIFFHSIIFSILFPTTLAFAAGK